MFSRKKDRVGLDLHQDFGSVNTTRTYNVRRQESWPIRILYNMDNEGAAADQDEHDKQHQDFFNCNGPQSNNAVLFGPTEVLPVAKPMKVLQTIIPLDFKAVFLNVVEMTNGHSRDHVNEDSHVRLPFTAKDGHVIEGDLMDNIDKLSVFLKAKNITEKNTQEIEGEKENDDFFTNKFIDDLDEAYLEVYSQPNRKKTTFMLRPGEPGGAEFPLASHKSDPALKTDGRSLQGIKKSVVKHKKVSPTAVPLRAPYGKHAEKADHKAPKVAVPAGDIFVPRKEYKLKTTNVNDFLRNSDIEMLKERIPIIPKEKIAKGEGLAITNVKKKFKEDDAMRNDSEKLNITRKERSNPLVDPHDQSEPLKKKVRVNPPSETPIDILGAITDAMDAAAAEKAAIGTEIEDSMSPRKKTEEWAHPRMYGQPMPPPSLPPRFAIQKDDTRDVSNSSPETSPRPLEEKSVSPTLHFEDQKEKRTIRSNDEKSLIAGGCKEIVMNCPELPISMDERVGELYTTEALHDENSHPMVINRPRIAIRYRLLELDKVKFAPAPMHRSKSFVSSQREIPFDQKNSNVTDPRLPAPLGLLSPWNNTRVVINLSSGEADVSTKGIDAGPTKQKGVQWGGTATKEFNPDDEERPMVKRSNETREIVVGEKEVGGKKYNIIKKVPSQSALPKSCLKPIANPWTVSKDKGVNGSGSIPFIPPSEMHIQDAYKKAFQLSSRPCDSSIGRTPRLPDFVPPPGYEVDVEKKKKEEREKKEKEEREKMEEKKKREREEMENKERERKKKEEAKKDILEGRFKYKEDGDSSSSSPQFTSSSNIRTALVSSKPANVNQGTRSSCSSANLNTRSPTISNYGGGSAPCSSKSMSCTTTTPSRPFEKGSDILGERPLMRAIHGEEAKYQLEMRSKIADRLMVQKTLRDGPVKEYPADREHPSIFEQREEQDTYYHELTMIEKDWKRNGIQPVWMQALPYQTHFSFQHDAGLYWPIVQATDRIDVHESDFQSMDVLRSLGNNTHFATEKKTLMGIDTRLPNGITHKERFDSFMKGTESEGRFKHRPMYSRVFSAQSEEEAREIHNERMEDERRLLREHEEVMKKNAPIGVSIAPCQMNIERPGFKDFPRMIQYYKNDDYETGKPFQDPNWYCNEAEYYMPYTERANYLCHVINHFNKEYNALYEDSFYSMTNLDKAAFAASQIYLERMEGWKRVGVSEGDYVHLMTRHKERRSLMESSSFSLDKYKELTQMTVVEHAYFHFIVDWLSSIFKMITPISEWPLDIELRSAFKEVIMISDKKTEDGQPRDAREVFYQAFKASIPQQPAAKKSRSSNTY